MYFPVPSKYTGEPFELFNIDSQSLKQDLLEHICDHPLFALDNFYGKNNLHPAKVHDGITKICSRIFQHYTKENLEEYFVLSPIVGQSRFQACGSGANLFFLCMWDSSTMPAQQLATAFHEIGHAMYFTPDFDKHEVAGMYIGELFGRTFFQELSCVSKHTAVHNAYRNIFFPKNFLDSSHLLAAAKARRILDHKDTLPLEFFGAKAHREYLTAQFSSEGYHSLFTPGDSRKVKF